MASGTSPLRSLTRNLGMATTGITVLITGLATLEIFVFLEPARLPLFVLTAVAWGGYYMVTTLINPLKSGKLIISAEGPGEEIVQKATYFSFQQQEEFAEGSKADEAFVRAEQAYLGYQYSRAATHYQESLAAKASVPAYVNAAISLLNSSLFEQAEELLGMGLALAERLELRPFQAACHANIGIIHARTGRSDSAVEACEQASGLFRQLGDGRGRADVQLTLGNIQANRGDWEAARRSFESALKRYEIAQSELGRANGQGNLGNMCMFQGELEEALRYHRKALEIHEQIGNPLGRANALSNIGTVRFRMTEFGEADTAYTRPLGSIGRSAPASVKRAR